MITREEKIRLIPKVKNNLYLLENKNSVSANDGVILGTSGRAARMMSASSEEWKKIGVTVMQLSPNSDEWETRIKDYFHSISVTILKGGRNLDIGFIYDATNIDHVNYIRAIKPSLAKVEDVDKLEKAMLDYYETRKEAILTAYTKAKSKEFDNPVEKDKNDKAAFDLKWNSIWKLETERYKYSSPINEEDYILYRHCLQYSRVANERDVISKSDNIGFYLYSDEEKAKIKQELTEINTAAMKFAVKAMNDTSLAKQVLILCNASNPSVLDSIMKLKEDDYANVLQEIARTNAKRLYDVSKLEDLELRSELEMMIYHRVLTRLQNSTTVVDAEVPTIIIGTNIKECISWFSVAKNKAKLDDYRKMLNSKML